MRITWHGHSCFEISNRTRIVTDPHDGKRIGLPCPLVKADMVLMSHDHYDHNCAHVVQGKPKLIKSEVDDIVLGVHIRTFRTFHDREGGKKRGWNLISWFELDGVKFLHLGDLGHILSKEIVSSFGNVDILFLPVGSVFTIDGREGWQTVQQIKPKIAVPMHYWIKGLLLGIRPLEDFLGHVSVPVRQVGNEVTFEETEIPEDTEVWVFHL